MHVTYIIYIYIYTRMLTMGSGPETYINHEIRIHCPLTIHYMLRNNYYNVLS